jgi:hypothetical protein
MLLSAAVPPKSKSPSPNRRHSPRPARSSSSTPASAARRRIDVPAPTAIVVPADITRIHHGAYGLEITARIPKIAGGAGSVTKFQLDVGRRFDYRGQARSFLTATCPIGHWGTRGEAGFSDGTRLHVLHVFSCGTAR